MSEQTQALPPDSKRSSRWLAWALGSGAFAATNGVFAKLTTASKTESLATSISHLFGSSSESKFLEILLRAAFFGLNLLSNAIMWILFTRALTASTSTTRVSILNTSANFLVTALLGMIVFSENLPLGWWLGASLLVAGSVVIGAREGAAQESDNKQTEGGVALDTAVGVDKADTVANGLGSGGVEQNVVVEGRFKDNPESEDDEPESYEDDESDIDAPVEGPSSSKSSN